MQLKNIHLIRGIAALIVLVYHAKWALWSGGQLYISKFGLHSFADYLLFGIDMLSSCGAQCVTMFFLLSAFVITHSYQQSKSLKLFYRVRLIRIYLPYLASIIFAVILLIFCGGYLIKQNCSTREYTDSLIQAYNELSLNGFLKALIFLPGKSYIGFNVVYWSLLQEVVFYILFPLYIRLSNRQLFLIGVLIISASFLFELGRLYFQSFFTFGMILYNLIYKAKISLPINKKWLKAMMLLLYILINILVKKNLEHLADAFTLVLFVLAVYYLTSKDFKSSVILKKLSEQSYSLYLFQFPVLMAYFTILSRITGQCIFYSRLPYYSGVVIALLINVPLYYLFEYPSLKLITQLKSTHKDLPQ